MKAMILAAGFGTRLGDLTREIPKPMLDVEGHPILEYIVVQLQRHGFDDIIINLHFRPEMIREYFGDGSRWGVRITYSYEPQLLGTAGGVKNVESFFVGCDDFLVHYGDVVTNVDFSEMLRFHRASGAIATLLVHERSRSNSVICADADGRIERFLERPTDDERRGIASPLVNSGVCIARRALLDAIPSGTAADLPRDVYVPLARRGEALFAWPLRGYRCAVDSPQRLDDLREAARSGALA
jgi:mannose-1-phosphate guanylyltransferase/phosphomannomutase